MLELWFKTPIVSIGENAAKSSSEISSRPLHPIHLVFAAMELECEFGQLPFPNSIDDVADATHGLTICYVLNKLPVFVVKGSIPDESAPWELDMCLASMFGLFHVVELDPEQNTDGSEVELLVLSSFLGCCTQCLVQGVKQLPL